MYTNLRVWNNWYIRLICEKFHMLVYMVVHVFTSTNLFIHFIPYLAFSLSTKIAVVCISGPNKKQNHLLLPCNKAQCQNNFLGWVHLNGLSRNELLITVTLQCRPASSPAWVVLSHTFAFCG